MNCRVAEGLSPVESDAVHKDPFANRKRKGLANRYQWKADGNFDVQRIAWPQVDNCGIDSRHDGTVTDGSGVDYDAVVTHRYFKKCKGALIAGCGAGNRVSRAGGDETNKDARESLA